MSFVRPRELASFSPRHVTRFPSIIKRICVGRYNVVYRGEVVIALLQHCWGQGGCLF